MSGGQADLSTRLRLLSLEAKSMASALRAAGGQAPDEWRARFDRWIETLDVLVAAAERSGAPAEPSTRGLLERALSGADIDIDGLELSLHDITQLAAALRPGASLTIRNSVCLSPLEQSSVWTVMPGQVRFT